MIIKILALLFLTYIIVSFYIKNRKCHPKEPKSIGIALPLIGHLYKLGKQPHRGLLQLVKENGPVFKMWFGDHYSIIITDPKLVHEILVRQFHIFTNKNRNTILELFSSGYNNIVHGRDQDWKELRTVVASAFSNRKIRNISDLIDNEVNSLLVELSNLSDSGQVFNPQMTCKIFSLNIIFRYVYSIQLEYGERAQDPRTLEIINQTDRLMKLMTRPWRFMKGISWVHFQYAKYFANPIELVKQEVQKIVYEHLDTIDPDHPRDLLDHLITTIGVDTDKNLTRIIHCGIDFILAGTETTSSTMEWIIVYLINYPEYQEKLYQEIVDATGSPDSLGQERHRKDTPLFNSFVKEVMRMNWTVPLTVGRECSEDVMIGDYFIPKGAQTYQFPYALMHSSEYWDEPEIFKPDRFINNQHSDIFMPFGLGPRICVGMSLATSEIFALVTNLILKFKLYSSNGKGEKVDTYESIIYAFD
ncbi:cytochrome P450 family protein [Cavenderia fasciculata]|uniref:Cytochrome P450 family protein n=1 Tax=Cavenderia fasciculata TaxID=261658 RepID=F4QA59_CACFS|nr:cytochrome P450 family protein [Cavenderia fasciculata]EGG15578.1 cytochrome P450 family protein [Cavenderia fasciculata]|eukprot:XP_004354320.1 cytochrome P450 family protein [Cavenderia fasciculata]